MSNDDLPTRWPSIGAGVRMFAPTASWVYGLSNARVWIYVGETADIRVALIAHLAGCRASMMNRNDRIV